MTSMNLKKSVVRLVWVTVVLCVGCQIHSPREELQDSKMDLYSGSDPKELRKTLPDAGKIDPKYSIAADREKFQAMRSDVSTDLQARNDEKALLAELMAATEIEPSQVRERFDGVVRRRREEFNRDMTKLRETYSRQERQQRESFTKELEAERETIKDQNFSREDRQRRISELDQKRRDYYSSEREQRDLFEADVRTARKDFDDYVKRKQDEFNAEYKIYQIRWRENKEGKK